MSENFSRTLLFIGTFDSYVLERFSNNLSWSNKKTQNKILTSPSVGWRK